MSENNQKNKNGSKKNNGKSLIIYAVIAFLFVYALTTAKDMLMNEEISYNEFIQMVENKEVEKVNVDGTALVITPTENSDKKGKILYTGNANNPDLIKLLYDNNVQYYPQITKQQSVFMDFILINVLPIILMFFALRFIFGKMSKRI